MINSFICPPKDRFGNYLGPGYENRLDITIANATAELVSEQLDGSYIIPLDPNTNLSTASVEVKLDGKVLLKFDLGKLKDSLPWWLPKVVKELLSEI